MATGNTLTMIIDANTTRARQSIKQLFNEMDGDGKKVAGTFTRIATHVASVGVAFGAWQVASGIFSQMKKLTESASDFQRLEYAMRRFSTSAEEAANNMKWVENVGKSTVGIKTLADAFVMLRSVGLKPTEAQLKGMMGYFMTVSKDAPQKFSEAISKMVTLFQNSTTGFQDSFKEISEYFPFAGGALKKKLGVYHSDVASFSKNNALDFATLFGAILDEAPKYEKAIEDTAGFWDRILQNIENRFEHFRKKLGEGDWFQTVSDQLRKLVSEYDRLSQNGQLDMYVERINNALDSLAKTIGIDNLSIEGLLDKFTKLVIWFDNATKTVKEFVGALSPVKETLFGLANLINEVPYGPEIAAYGLLGFWMYGKQGAAIGTASGSAWILLRNMNSKYKEWTGSNLYPDGKSLDWLGGAISGPSSDPTAPVLDYKSGTPSAKERSIEEIVEVFLNGTNTPSGMQFGGVSFQTPGYSWVPGYAPKELGLNGSAGYGSSISQGYDMPGRLDQERIVSSAAAAVTTLMTEKQLYEKYKDSEGYIRDRTPRDYPGDVMVDGKVVEVEDGDTFWVYRGGKIDKVRVQGIDTPESVMGQAYGKEATEELKRMILGKVIDVRYDQNAEKTYGRYVGEMWSKDGKTDYSYEMLKKGAAWSFDAFNRGTWRDGLYDAQMATSKAAKLGLWADPGATNPSSFRHWFKKSRGLEGDEFDHDQPMAGEIPLLIQHDNISKLGRTMFKDISNRATTAGLTELERDTADAQRRLDEYEQNYKSRKTLLETIKNNLESEQRDTEQVDKLIVNADTDWKNAQADTADYLAGKRAFWDEKVNNRMAEVTQSVEIIRDKINDAKGNVQEVFMEMSSETFGTDNVASRALVDSIERDINNKLQGWDRVTNQIKQAIVNMGQDVRRGQLESGQQYGAHGQGKIEEAEALLKWWTEYVGESADKLNEMGKYKVNVFWSKAETQDLTNLTNLKQSYLALTGSMEDNLKVREELSSFQTSQQWLDAPDFSGRKDAIGEIGRISREKMRIEREGSFFEGTGLGFWEQRLEVPTQAQRGMEMARSLTSAFDGLTDSITELATTGTTDFRQFAQSVTADMLRIALRALIVDKLMKAFFSMFMPTGFNSSFSGSVSGVDASKFAQPWAMGGVTSGISMYKNQIVSDPTFFRFASGIGLMGEAGSEAIMPLTRTAYGDLGVRTIVGDSRSEIVLPITRTKSGDLGVKALSEFFPSYEHTLYAGNTYSNTLNTDRSHNATSSIYQNVLNQIYHRNSTYNNEFNTNRPNNTTANTYQNTFEQLSRAGDVYRNLSMYENEIVSYPTQFMFASGAGLMGEAGPEAIIPLTRTKSGDLGVKAVGSSGGVSMENNIVVNVSASPGTTEAQSKETGKLVATAVRAQLDEYMTEQMRPGGLLNQGRSY